MKKALYILSGLIFLASISFAASIAVTKPANGDVWAKSDAHVIEWRTNGEMHAKVKIRLFNGNGTIRIKGISDDTPTDDRRFRCPPNFFNDVPGGTYTIKVRTLNNNVTGISAPFFIGEPPTIDRTVEEVGTIEDRRTPSPPPFGKLIKKPTNNIPNLNRNIRHLLPSIVITHPPKDHVWKLRLGNTALPFPIRVMWRKTGVGNQDSRVKIFLRRVVNGVQTTLLTQSTANNGLYRGGISRDLISSMYTIIIETLDGKIRVESDTFLIVNAENDPH